MAAAAAACVPEAGNDHSRIGRHEVARVPGAGASPESMIYIARSAASAGDYGAAVRMYRAAYREDQKNTAILMELGRTLGAMGAHNEAVETFRTAVGIEGDLAREQTTGDPPAPDIARRVTARRLDAMQGLGNALIAVDRPSQAVSQFEAALNIGEQPRAYNGLGVAHDMLGDHSLAQAFYRTGLQADPRDLSLINNLGLSLAVSGAFDEAIEILRRAALDPRATSRQRLNLALAYGLAGQTEAAAEISRIDLDEASVRANLVYYRTLRALNDRKAMINALGVHEVLPDPGVSGRRPAAPPLPARPHLRDAGQGYGGRLPGATRPRAPYQPQATR